MADTLLPMKMGHLMSSNYIISTLLHMKRYGKIISVWLTQQQMAELYQTSRTNIVEHIRHIYEEGELEESSTCRNFRQVRKEGNRELPFYNLDRLTGNESVRINRNLGGV